MSELKEIHISDFYWYVPNQSIILFAPKEEYKNILPTHRTTSREKGEYLCRKSIWENKSRLNLSIKYRFLIMGNFIPQELIIF